MEFLGLRTRSSASRTRGALAFLCAGLLVPGEAVLLAQQAPTPASAAAAVAPAAGGAEESAKLSPEQLDSLVAPIALYPDALLAQTLVASTYPLELIQLQQWLAKHKDLKDKALAEAVAKQPWDPAIQSMAAIPEVVKRLSDDIQWTTDLGNAFLGQQDDVMAACQRMRKKAQDKGALQTNDQQKVETKVVETKEVIVVESANPEVIYVPSYSPTVVYGASYYPYPPIYYPPYYPGTALISFGIGMAWGAAIWGGSCCGCGWGGGNNNININRNNNFNRATQYNRGDGGRGGNNWQHNSKHRGGAPYGDKATANKYGGSARGDSRSSRQASARQQPAGSRGGGSQAALGGGSLGSGSGSRGGAGAGVSDRSAGGGGSRGGGGGDRVGSRDIPSGGGSRGGGGFGGGSSGYSGRSASAASSRGSSSMGSRGGGGMSRGGGGGRGGGGRR